MSGLGEYKGLLLLGIVTFCAVCVIQFISTLVFGQGEYNDLLSAGKIYFFRNSK
ncbi:MAG: hypothetical protein ACOY46_03345 [Bacillota bacterium]